jgi:hypothetical protein
VYLAFLFLHCDARRCRLVALGAICPSPAQVYGDRGRGVFFRRFGLVGANWRNAWQFCGELNGAYSGPSWRPRCPHCFCLSGLGAGQFAPPDPPSVPVALRCSRS